MTLILRNDLADAIKTAHPVVALESTLITHGLPWPDNLATARAEEQAVIEEGALAATIAILDGMPHIGLTSEQIETLARTDNVVKASRRDLAAVMTRGVTASTTVAGTMALAHAAGIRIMATGGIGGVHHGDRFDISADLVELARTPMAVVCSGAKSILDLARTLELLETLAVPVIGFGTDELPAFYIRESGLPVSSRFDDASIIARFLHVHWELGGKGVIVAQPIAEEAALDRDDFEQIRQTAERELIARKIEGSAVTPYLLARLHELSGGHTLTANKRLVRDNARLAAKLALELMDRAELGTFLPPGATNS